MSDNLVDFSLFVRREFPTRFFARGDAIHRDGEQADEFFVVGRHFSSRRLPHQISTSPRTSVIDDSARSATVVALTDVTLAPI